MITEKQKQVREIKKSDLSDQTVEILNEIAAEDPTEFKEFLLKMAVDVYPDSNDAGYLKKKNSIYFLEWLNDLHSTLLQVKKYGTVNPTSQLSVEMLTDKSISLLNELVAYQPILELKTNLFYLFSDVIFDPEDTLTSDEKDKIHSVFKDFNNLLDFIHRDINNDKK